MSGLPSLYNIYMEINQIIVSYDSDLAFWPSGNASISCIM